ncbi:AraC family transcriptional regulator [Catenuloplanes atrovinosus]|uniref:AraC-like DNA-binding protein/mannose-6-phosphate isomerase-like protein (Cupin superfamily) n=1 Tax=Catenuloplanes atrovinosus TaxID=137266 RepID=A0AAE3YMX3_9ACTN|nr:AraC family transcriptional regulator [Catenuloplanes atrovinosus]MDR7276440.1 AraC-like DNA-binding protein/mannose-6-phosphate isomerase-like protein (cupin superfamily) [Catenuloplanes atrovinosus]
MGPGEVPLRRSAHATSNIDEAHEALRRFYFDFTAHVPRDLAQFTYSLRSVDSGVIGLDRLRYSTTLDIVTEPVQYVHATYLLSGSLTVRSGGEQVRVAPGELVLVPPGKAFQGRLDDFDVRILRLPLSAVTHAAAARWGIEPADFAFRSMTPISAPLARYWRETLAYLHRVALNPDAALPSAPAHAAIVDLAAAATIATFPSTASTACYLPGPGHTGPGPVRRAIAYLEEKASDAVTLADVAAAAGTGPRGLQAAFRRHLDTTPMGYLRRIRLERAHRDLLGADPGRGATVGAIARQWGFTHLGRFAAAYRETYGTSPAETLRTR